MEAFFHVVTQQSTLPPSCGFITWALVFKVTAFGTRPKDSERIQMYSQVVYGPGLEMAYSVSCYGLEFSHVTSTN